MDWADNPMSVAIPSGEQTDQTNKFQYTTQPDCFIIDVDKDSFSNGTSSQISQIFKITRNLSKKGMIIIRGGNKVGKDHGGGDDTAKSVPPIDSVVLGGSSEELGGGGGGDSSGGISHEIAITSGAERLRLRRNSLKRYSQACTWHFDPRNIVLFCATLSCLGTMVLIYLAFSSRMAKVEDINFDS